MIPGWQDGVSLSPEDIMVDGVVPAGDHVVVFDTDGYFMGVSIAEHVAALGKKVTYVTPLDTMAPYMRKTLEEQRVYERLQSLGVRILTQTSLDLMGADHVRISHVWSGATEEIPSSAVVFTTQRVSDDSLYRDLMQPGIIEEAGVRGVFLIGDAFAPGLIAQSVFQAHRLAREFDSDDPHTPLPFIRERRLADHENYTFAQPLSIRPSRLEVARG